MRQVTKVSYETEKIDWLSWHKNTKKIPMNSKKKSGKLKSKCPKWLKNDLTGLKTQLDRVLRNGSLLRQVDHRCRWLKANQSLNPKDKNCLRRK